MISYGTKEAAEGYVMLGEDAVFWLSPQGEAIMGALLGENGLEEKPLAELGAEFQTEVAFWTAQGQDKKPTGMASVALAGLSLAAAPLSWAVVAVLATLGLGLFAYNAYQAVHSRRMESRFNAFLKAASTRAAQPAMNRLLPARPDVKLR